MDNQSHLPASRTPSRSRKIMEQVSAVTYFRHIIIIMKKIMIIKGKCCLIPSHFCLLRNVIVTFCCFLRPIPSLSLQVCLNNLQALIRKDRMYFVITALQSRKGDCQTYKKAVLSQGEPRDAAANLDTYRRSLLFTPIPPEFWGVSFDQITHVGVSPSQNLKPISREIILFSKYSNLCKNIPERHRQTDRQTERQTDDLAWHNRALRSIAR